MMPGVFLPPTPHVLFSAFRGHGAVRANTQSREAAHPELVAECLSGWAGGRSGCASWKKRAAACPCRRKPAPWICETFSLPSISVAFALGRKPRLPNGMAAPKAEFLSELTQCSFFVLAKSLIAWHLPLAPNRGRRALWRGSDEFSGHITISCGNRVQNRVMVEMTIGYSPASGVQHG